MRAFFADDPNLYSIADLAQMAESLEDRDERDIDGDVAAIIRKIDSGMGWDDAEDESDEDIDDFEEEDVPPLPAADTIRW